VALNLADEAADQLAVRAARRRRAIGHPGAAFRTINHELHSAISASCICRKSAGEFFPLG
jgi:hypothetical protein